jgi:ribonuclease HII
MARAVAALGVTPDLALVDGDRLPPLPCRAQAVVGGDALCLSIAAASIAAKVTRDRLMGRLALRPSHRWLTY